MLLHVVADYGVSDLAYSEVVQRFAHFLPEARPVYTAVPPFATLAAGFCVAQLALNQGPADMAVFQNVAPRGDDAAARPDNDGEKLVFARTPQGRLIVGPNSGFSFSFLAQAGCELRSLKVKSGGSQFRSRDIFAQACARLLCGDESDVGDAVSPGAVPGVPESAIAYVDGFGNIKTTINRSSSSPGTRLQVTISGVKHEAVVAGGGFEVPSGVLAFAPGSSGWSSKDGEQFRFFELFLRGGNAWATFGQPKFGADIRINELVATS